MRSVSFALVSSLWANCNTELGTSLWNVLDLLRGMQHFFPQVDVKYDPDSPTTPIVLHIRPHLDLLFSGYQQRLHTISVKKLREPHPPLTLTYKKAVLSSNDEVLRRVSVSRMFGPTYPGDDLRYPGVSFSFEEDGRGESLKSPSGADDRQQEVKRVIISQKSADGEQRDALDEVTECPVMAGELSRAIVKVAQSPIPSTRSMTRVVIGSRRCHSPFLPNGVDINSGPPGYQHSTRSNV